jgi:hypothetical protein
MEHNDIFFYLVVAASVIGSVVKAIKKKPEEGSVEPKRNVGGDILRKLLEEMGEKDDYIPRNPVPVPAAKPIAKTPVGSSGKSNGNVSRTGRVEPGYVVPETKESHAVAFTGKRLEPEVEEVDPILPSIDLSSHDEMKKAIIYSEIFRTKF